MVNQCFADSQGWGNCFDARTKKDLLGEWGSFLRGTAWSRPRFLSWLPHNSVNLCYLCN